jgi:hypothetical protein
VCNDYFNCGMNVQVRKSNLNDFQFLVKLALASESRYFKKPSESHIFVSTKKLLKHGTLQTQQK